MPPFQFVDWWGRESHHGTSVVVKMENPNWSVLELESPDGDFQTGNKERGRNAKQLTWVLLLKAHRAAGCLAWMAHGLWAVLFAVKRRLSTSPGSSSFANRPRKGKLYRAIIFVLAFALLMLCFELVGHYKGWHFYTPHLRMPHSPDLQSLLQSVYLAWLYAREHYLGPSLQALANACIFMFLLQSVDRFTQCLGALWIKVRRIKPLPHLESFELGDVEDSEAEYPMVLVQIPMCNEREVYQQSIAAAAHLDWPKGKILIQVLDDSDDIEVQDLIKSEVQKWQQNGMRIVYQHRVVRTGYKAGNLKAAMNCDYVKDYEFVAIFDADFQPQPDFLKRTVIHFKGNDELGLVQARWIFVNRDENLLTRLQDINLCYHFEVEQQVNGVFLNFFGFNGTAGVWRIKALEESGGWLERTTVEDMDIAVRAHLCGWKFIFLNDVKCVCELPESFETYRKQQHRWHSGPMQLFRLCLPHIVSSKISKGKKANLIFLFFLLRKLILPFYSFTLFCIILPMTMFIPEAQLPAWVVCYVPALMSFLNIMPAPKSFPFIVPYLLFENTMSVTKFNAMISGLFQLGSAYEWVVTKKVGRASETDLAGIGQLTEQEEGLATTEQELPVPKLADPLQPHKKKVNRIYRKELALALLLLTASARSLLSVQGIHFYFLLFQGIAFLVVGLDLIGEQVS
ncbi:hypothetical protein GOP47_0005003 [Adiantum capillus-veneris]|uniref:Glycosyltransferase 2-like domain-containing protein n=1 Tax=Adiantum capillus-veneris TaxID=13818 RepID=A0A9D4ZL67_ADICA|nr:hypothetical protein GOP47_0005003 [Adiantum capillus-veneris]